MKKDFFKACFTME